MKKPILIFVPSILALMMTMTGGLTAAASTGNKVLNLFERQAGSVDSAPAEETSLPDGLHLASNGSKSRSSAAKSTTATTKTTTSTANSATKYIVKSGDTLTRVSARTGVSVEKLMKINGLKSNNLKIGQTLSVTGSAAPAPEKKLTKTVVTESPAPKPVAKSAPGKLYYVKHEVKRGETVAQLARKYDVSAESILLANNLPEDASLPAGRTVSVPVRGTTAKVTTPKPADSGKTPATKQAYEVKGQDTFYSLATMYGVSVDELKEANPGVSPERLRPGTVLKIPVRAGRKDTPSALTKSTEDKKAVEKEIPAEGFAPQELHSNKNIKPAQGTPKGKPEPIALEDMHLPLENLGTDPYFDYTIEPNDTWENIGAQFRTTGDEIKRINGIKSNQEPQIGNSISVPRSRIGSRTTSRVGNHQA